MSNKCLICYDEIDNESKIEYLSINDSWKTMDYCINCINYELESMWDRYIDGLKKADCEASLKRLIKYGPPIYYKSPDLNDGENIKQFRQNNNIISGRLQKVPSDTVVNELNKKLNTLIPLIEDQNNLDVDYMSKLNEILQEFNL